jgi:hypothetical protein
MRVLATVALLLALLVAPGSAQPPASGALTPQIESLLKKIKAADTGLLAVSEEDGRFLRLMVAARGAKSILEIGAASGYSSIWLGLGARESGGKVVSIEYDPQRAREAAATSGRPGSPASSALWPATPSRKSPRSPAPSISYSSMPGSRTTRNFSTWSTPA